jgi:Membrane bound beta barrel domain (DUF5777)
MKKQYSSIKSHSIKIGFLALLLMANVLLYAQQDSTAKNQEPQPRARIRPVKNTFMSQWIIDNQTVMVPVKGSLEFDFQHRFGTVDNGYQDFWGFFSPSFNIRMGLTYTFIKNLSVGFGITKSGLTWDGNAKYSILTQTPSKYPVSLTVFGDMAVNTFKDATLYDGSPIVHNSDRFNYFSSIIIARKITEKFSAQATLSVSHQNAVGGYYTKNDSTGTAIYQSMYHDHFAIALSGKYSVTSVSAIIIDYNQPLTHHPAYNPHPSIGLGYEVTTSGHAFQFFLTNYTLLVPQNNNLYNQNNPFGYTDHGTGTFYPGGQWVIGFNITKLWNY